MDAVGLHDPLVDRGQTENHKGREGRGVVFPAFSEAPRELSSGCWATWVLSLGWGKDQTRGSERLPSTTETRALLGPARSLALEPRPM